MKLARNFHYYVYSQYDTCSKTNKHIFRCVLCKSRFLSEPGSKNECGCRAIPFCEVVGAKIPAQVIMDFY